MHRLAYIPYRLAFDLISLFSWMLNAIFFGGSTFINGAVDGTALTADTTPTALPDLSASTLELAPTFNGFIKTFRAWGVDIGDTGIAEAST